MIEVKAETISQCVGCGESFPVAELKRVGLVLLCQSCIDESEDIQSLQAQMFGPCGDW